MADEKNKTITHGDESYELKYNEKTIETIETITGRGFMRTLSESNGLFSLVQLRVYFTNALYKVGGGRVSPDQASEIFYALLKEKGFAYLNMLVIYQIQHDCPFFFQTNLPS